MYIKIVIFDCDGVMFDTREANKAYYNSILKHFNKPEMTSEQFGFAQMHTAENSLDYLFKGDEKNLEKARLFRKKMSYFPFIKQMEIEPHLKPLLNKLRASYKTAVATNRTDTMGRVLQDHGLEGLFDMVVTALDVDQPKPHPEQLLKILTRYSIKPDQAVYVGDSKLDEMAASAANVPLVAFQNTSLVAAYHITSLKELEGILKARQDECSDTQEADL